MFGTGLGAAVSRLLSARGGEEEEEDGAGLLSRVPVVPVPTVQASELTVSVFECVCVRFVLHVNINTLFSLSQLQFYFIQQSKDKINSECFFFCET